MYDALDVAEYVIFYEDRRSRPVSNLRLQKLLYFVQAQFWATRNHACFSDSMEAWKLGPVIPSVYRKYKFYGSLDFPRKLVTSVKVICARDQDLINTALEKCSHYTTSTLITLTHGQTPWIEAYKRGNDNTISPDSMQTYFGVVQ